MRGSTVLVNYYYYYIYIYSVMEGFKSKDIDTRARTAWKYGCHRGITGTPQFIINGVHDPTAPDLDYRGWERVIDRLKAMN